MSKVRTTIVIDTDILRAVETRAARTGSSSSEVIEQAVRRDLGRDTLEQLRSRQDMEPAEAEALALEAQSAVRNPTTRPDRLR